VISIIATVSLYTYRTVLQHASEAIVNLLREWVGKTRLLLHLEAHAKKKASSVLKLFALAKMPRHYLEGVKAYRTQLEEFNLLNSEAVIKYLEEGVKKSKWLLKTAINDKVLREYGREFVEKYTENRKLVHYNMVKYYFAIKAAFRESSSGE